MIANEGRLLSMETLAFVLRCCRVCGAALPLHGCLTSDWASALCLKCECMLSTVNVFSCSTVLSGAEERFAQERPGCNCQILKELARLGI